MATKTATVGKAFQPDSDVHVTFEDQQKINRFAKHNARLEDYKRELEIRKNELKSLEEACEEIELFEDEDMEEMFPFQVGEVFICHGLSQTQELLAAEKAKNQKEIKEIEDKCAGIQQIMNELKAQLYHRFGSNISLENDD